MIRHAIPLWLLFALLAGPQAFAWRLSGTVVDDHALPLAGVQVTMDNATLLLTTDNEGRFQIGSSGVRQSTRASSVSLRSSGSDLVVEGLPDGQVLAEVLDFAGRFQWRQTRVSIGNRCRFDFPRSARNTSEILRILQHGEVVWKGKWNEAFSSVSASRVSARSASTDRTLRFHKSGFLDTSLVLSGDSLANLQLVMTPVPSSLLQGTWTADTIYSVEDGRILMQSTLELSFYQDHSYRFAIYGQANWQPIVGNVFQGTGTWKEVGADTVEVHLTACAQPDTSTLEVATFPAVVPFHEEGTGSNTYYVANALKPTTCPEAGKVWARWGDTMSALLPVRMILADTTWDFSLARRR